MTRKQCKDMVLFLILTFLLPLTAIYLQMLTNHSMIRFILYGIEAAAPSIAAIIMTTCHKDFKKFFHQNFKIEKLICALALPVIITFTTMFLTKILVSTFITNCNITVNISITQGIIILWSFIAEELGWRGYLQPLLNKQIKYPSFVPFIVGTIWCLWHYHYFLFGDMQVPFLLFFAGCIAESYIYQYLLKWSNNNLVSAMMYHFTWNLGIHLFALNPIDNGGDSLPYGILIMIEILMLILFHFSKIIISRFRFIKLKGII